MNSIVSFPPRESRVAAEFERLSGFPLSAVEAELVERVSAAEPAWLEGHRPEALAWLAVSLAETLGKRILFLSPDAEQLVQRQHRLGTRAATQLITDRTSARLPQAASTVWCSLDALQSEIVRRNLASYAPDWIFVEHAHAASSAAFEYRPSLKQLPDLAERLGASLLVAGSARAPLSVREDAQKSLGFLGSKYLAEPLSVTSLQLLEQDPREARAAWIARLPRPTLLLCGTPAEADTLYAELRAEQLPCHRYHAGLSAKERATELLQFALPGRRALLVATSSFGPASGLAGDTDGRFQEDFGRGYTRCDIRSLVHFGLPCSLEQYGQELGLLRRDGTAQNPSYAVAVYDPARIQLARELLARKRPCPSTLQAVVEKLKSQARGSWISETHLLQSLGDQERAVRLVLRFLQDAGALENSINVGALELRARSLKALQQITHELDQAFEALSDGDQAREANLVRFAKSEGCRLQAFHRALSTEIPEPCGTCDQCDPEWSVRDGALFTREESAARRLSPARRFHVDADFEETEEEEFFSFDDEALAAN